MFSLCDNLCAVLLILLSLLLSSSPPSSSSLHCSYTTIITHSFRPARGKITLKLYIMRCVSLYTDIVAVLYIYTTYDGVVLCVRACVCVLGGVECESGWLWQSINGKLFPTQCGGYPDKYTHTHHTHPLTHTHTHARIILYARRAHAHGRDHGNRHVINRQGGASRITGVNKSFVFCT